MKLERNVGRIDRLIRLAMGAGMLSMLFWAPESGYWGLLGVLPIASAISGFCPTYQLIGLKTRSARNG